MEFNLLGQRTYPVEESGEPPLPPLKTYRDLDCPPRSSLLGKQALVIGYGLQGEPTALNLRDSGAEVTVGVRLDTASGARAVAADFPILDFTRPLPENFESIWILIPDSVQADILRQWILPAMHPTQLLVFAHGYALIHETLAMPRGVDVVVLAPHGPGKQLRERYLAGEGLPAQVALWRDHSGISLTRALQWGAGLGYDWGGMRPCTVKQEVDLDHFVEQTLLCGGLLALAQAVYDTAIAQGYDPVQVYNSTIGEVGNTAMLLQQYGPVEFYKRISEIAMKGSLLNGPAMVNDQSRAHLAATLAQIESGAFIKALELPDMNKELRTRMQALKAHPMTSDD
ncbi:MAG: hypothetical protein ABI743_04535 [bacterium]